MSPPNVPILVHPQGERNSELIPGNQACLLPSIPVDTVGHRFHVEWDPEAPVTPLGQLVFFCQFLAAGGLYSPWVRECPLSYSSPNAPAVQDVLGTWVLGTLAGAWRYSHVTAIRGDKVNSQGLGMEKVVSEDSLRRAFQDEEAEPLERWQTEALLRTYAPALEQPWIADLDVTVKPIYGHQEGAEVGYNPHKPGRPSHAYHTIFLRTLRVALDVEVHSGKEHAAVYGLHPSVESLGPANAQPTAVVALRRCQLRQPTHDGRMRRAQTKVFVPATEHSQSPATLAIAGETGGLAGVSGGMGRK